MTEEKIHKDRTGSWWALSPLLVFLCLYLVTSILVNDFYKVPITVAFLVSSCYAIAITKGLKLDQRIYQFSVGAANKNILLMIWIFILAGAFAHSAKQMGAIDATVNLTLHILPDNLLLAGIFIAACFISLSIGTSVGTIVALTPVAVGLAEKTEIQVRLRSSQAPVAAEFLPQSADTAAIRFFSRQKAVAAGQSAVFYDNDGYVLGGGFIKGTQNAAV